MDNRRQKEIRLAKWAMESFRNAGFTMEGGVPPNMQLPSLMATYSHIATRLNERILAELGPEGFGSFLRVVNMPSFKKYQSFTLFIIKSLRTLELIIDNFDPKVTVPNGTYKPVLREPDRFYVNRHMEEFKFFAEQLALDGSWVTPSGMWVQSALIGSSLEEARMLQFNDIRTTLQYKEERIRKLQTQVSSLSVVYQLWMEKMGNDNV